MIEVEEIRPSAPAMRWKRAGWLPGVLLRPARTMRAIAAEDRSVWQIPMILLTLLTLALVIVASPLRQQAAQAMPAEPPPGFEYMSPEQQQQYMAAQASASGSTQTLVFPAVGGVLGLWLGFLVFGGLMHLILTMLGSRGTSASAFNLVGWAALPLSIRAVVQLVYMLTAHRLIAAPGLAGFIAADATGAAAFGRVMLAMVDIYLLWQMVLLWVGAWASGGLSKRKAASGVIIAMLIYLALSALPAFLMAQISGLSTQRPFFF
jgi:hypothetical protein